MANDGPSVPLEAVYGVLDQIAQDEHDRLDALEKKMEKIISEAFRRGALLGFLLGTAIGGVTYCAIWFGLHRPK